MLGKISYEPHREWCTSLMETMSISDARDHLLDAMETARTEAVFEGPNIPGSSSRPISGGREPRVHGDLLACALAKSKHTYGVTKAVCGLT